MSGKRMSWPERIATARLTGGFSLEDLALAETWSACACGEQDALIPRHPSGIPKDDKLSLLGLYFLRAVTYDEIDRAAQLMEQIEIRSSEVLEEIGGPGDQPLMAAAEVL